MNVHYLGARVAALNTKESVRWDMGTQAINKINNKQYVTG